MPDIEKIYKEYFESIYKYLICLTHNKDLAEDLTQETFYRAVKKIDTYKENNKMSAWLCRIARNIWYDQCRKNKKITNIEEKELIDISDKNLLENIVITNDKKIYLYKKMQNLDAKSREVMYLRITGELTFKEIGDILGKSENWARIIFYRAKKNMKEDKYYEE